MWPMPHRPRDYLNALAVPNSEFADRLGVVIAGGLGLCKLTESHYGSIYMSRATGEYLEPFDDDGIARRAANWRPRPFAWCPHSPSTRAVRRARPPS